MEAGDRDSAAPLSWETYRDAAPRSFFALVCFLERATAEASRVGEAGPVAHEAIRFRSDPDLAFPSGDVSAVRVVDRPPHFEIITTFLGLSGVTSPLPPYISESVLMDTFEEGTQRDFLDLFHHRALSLLFRAVLRLDPAREHRSDGLDPWLCRLLAMAGIDPDPEIALLPRHLMVLLPILLKRSRGAAALRTALRVIVQSEIPHADVRVRELAGRWQRVDDDEHTRLGLRRNALGQQTIMGRRVYDRRGRFAIQVGTLTRDEAARLAEGQPLLDRVRATVSLVLREPLEYDLEVELDEDAAENLRIGFSRLGDARLAGFQGSEVRIIRNVGGPLGANRPLA